MASSSYPSYFPLLCLLMFLAVSSVGKAMAFDYSQYDEPYVVFPQPAPGLGDGGDNYDYEYDIDYPQPPEPESREGGDYDYEYDIDYPQPPAPSPAAEYCPNVVERISTCQEYLNGHKDSPSTACCDNILDLGFIAVDLGYKNTCDCIKDLQASFHQRRAEDGIFKECSRRGAYSYLPISRQECSKY